MAEAETCKNCGFATKQTLDPQKLFPTDPASDPRQQLIDLDSSITRLQSLILLLEQRRVPIKKEINARSTVQRLPPEIASEIFVTYLGDESHKLDDLIVSKRLSISKMPLLFGRICKAWRVLAWSTPRLWTLVQLDIKTNLDPTLIDEWLIRSGALPLSICVAQSAGSLGLGSREYMVDLIAQHAERWRHVAFMIDWPLYSRLHCVQHHLPSLESISIHKLPWTRRGAHVYTHIFSDAFQLRNVHLACSLSSVHFPTEKLTKLSLDGNLARDCLNMLREIPHITHCVFNDIWFQYPRLTMACAPYLETLELSFGSPCEEHDISSFFDSLITPALRRFSCGTSCTERQFPHSSFLSLVSRSSCTLQSFSLRDWDISDRELIHCLRAIPSIHTLLLSKLTVIDPKETFRILEPCSSATNTSSDILLPNLETFEYVTWYLSDFYFTGIASFLRSRWELDRPSGVARLQSAKFVASRYVGPEPHLMAPLLPLVDDGMRVEVEIIDGTKTRRSWPYTESYARPSVNTTN